MKVVKLPMATEKPCFQTRNPRELETGYVPFGVRQPDLLKAQWHKIIENIFPVKLFSFPQPLHYEAILLCPHCP
jgi:hypothetical protein